jgi:S-DNA-T family DNA segregation ATPase FtsK/SpoIIIE
LFFRKKTTPLNSRREVVAEKSPGIVREAWWMILLLVGLYLTVILFSYHRDDPSWSHSASDSTVIHNAGGTVGAWLSDILLYLFGFSAWWWVVLAFYAIWLVYLRLEVVAAQHKPILLFNLVGFCILLVSSCALEAGHIIPLPADLPLSAGGMLGDVIDEILRSMLGFDGSTLVLLMMMAIGFSLFTGWSWIMMTEKLGAGLEIGYLYLRHTWQDWQDRKAGRVAEQLRAEFVDNERKRTEDRPPVQIETPAVEIVKSERVQRE